ncbi:MAG: protein translocase subunit SecD [Rhabdochlamydiaceae bacterium]|nr:protein translocase subunit SecD [Rhabdochlamydiaceae bacterium]
MQKQKRWQWILILAVTVLTIYNILPTIFFYTKPLKSPIYESRGNQIAIDVAKRINSLEEESLQWIRSFCKLLQVKPQSIQLSPQDPGIVLVTFQNSDQAKTFRHFLPRAGALIPFIPAQLSLYGETENTENKIVQVQRNVPSHFDPNLINSFFQFSTKINDQGQITPLYYALIKDRLMQIALSLGGISQNAQFVQALLASTDSVLSQELATSLADSLNSFAQTFGTQSDVAKRYFSSFTQTENGNRADIANAFVNKLDNVSRSVQNQIDELSREEAALKEQGKYLDASQLQLKQMLSNKVNWLQSAISILKNNTPSFSKGSQPWTYSNIGPYLQAAPLQQLSLEGRNPFIESIQIDWRNEIISLQLYKDVLDLKNLSSTQAPREFERIEQFLFNEMALLARQTEETVAPASSGNYQVALSQLTNSKSFLAFRLASIAQAETNDIQSHIKASWNPKHPDLQPNVFPVLDYESYISLPVDQKTVSLIVYAPVTQSKVPEMGFRTNSVYVIAKGMDRILKKIEIDPSSEQSQIFLQDFYKLRDLLQKSGYMGYEGSLLSVSKEFAGDFIFELPNYFQNVLAASRENFQVKGTQRYAVLEFTDVEQRILTENKIDTSIHEDLLKWRDDYIAAKLNINGATAFDVPKPTQSALWSNFKLSFIKYFRGDDRKVLHWGLDLSGGKTIQIELRDSNNRAVTDELDLRQGMNELYNRVNKMGVSEVSIRQEGNLITLDFPGSQNLSAAELVKASSMYFHVVNEKFTDNNPLLSNAVQKFLQEVWNEAVVSNRKTVEDINLIAWKHLYGNAVDPDLIQPRSESARTLYDNGLRLSNPMDSHASNVFDDTLSQVALFRGDDYTQWHGQTHPLLIVFDNFALEGSNLENVHASYDPSQGNFLSFNIQGSYTSKEGIKINPREDLHAWTLPFSKEKIAGTPNGKFSRNLGWRMAVILNGTIVNAPTLNSPLKDSAMITGSFSQREMNQLEGDLKAGSLSFTPKILSEKNVSPELGNKERSMGIWATIIALLLVLIVMISYYRFSGVVASVAVIFNLLIMWATLQNIQATLTLASLAGLILTIGMAVDANVLVFERIREEFALTGRITTAVQAGYKKAFSAILDSNVTTIIAALILLNFDSGPIKGFAITLIIGIVSSMFTALFMTKYFFMGWIQNPEHKSLKMMNIFKAKRFNFLKYTPHTIAISALVILVGGVLSIKEKSSLLGMDFTGGYALNLELVPSQEEHYRYAVERALVQSGVKPQEIQIRELSPSNQVRIFLSRSLDSPGRPLHNTYLNASEATAFKIQWVVSSLQKHEVAIENSSITTIAQNWSEVSGQMSDTMRNSAIIGLLIALISIFVYIAIRFEFKYAASATICLIHDVLFAFAAIALLHFLGVPLQIDLNTIAALMTIVGYSLNDTIIVFDRIREDSIHMRKSSFADIINHSLNITLSRTIMTSGTTLLVLVPLIAMGGSTIFGFALVMAIGVIFGTLSSLFVAAPCMLFFHTKEKNKQQRMALNR